jgi:hypothetical protein
MSMSMSAALPTTVGDVGSPTIEFFVRHRPGHDRGGQPGRPPRLFRARPRAGSQASDRHG